MVDEIRLLGHDRKANNKLQKLKDNKYRIVTEFFVRTGQSLEGNFIDFSGGPMLTEGKPIPNIDNLNLEVKKINFKDVDAGGLITISILDLGLEGEK
jgi:hypothetical protein